MLTIRRAARSWISRDGPFDIAELEQYRQEIEDLMEVDSEPYEGHDSSSKLDPGRSPSEEAMSIFVPSMAQKANVEES